MNKSIKFGITAGALFAAGLFVTTTPARATIVTSSNIAAFATATYRNAGGGTSSTTILNNQYGGDQLDVGNNTPGNWAALTWANNPQDLSRVFLGFTVQVPTYTIASFVVQTSTVANPSGANNGDWTTVQSFSGYPLTQSGFAVSPGVTNATGLRIYTTDNSTPDGKMRINEVMAFNNYHNLALTATVHADNWFTGNLFLNDENPADQGYGPLATAPTNTFTWATQQHIGGMLIEGGNGTFPGTYSVQAWDGGSWSTVTNIVGNVQVSQNLVFDHIVTTDQLRLYYTAAGGSPDGLMRVGEIVIFEAIPEPSTFMLLGLGGLFVWRRVRQSRRGYGNVNDA